MDLTPLATAVCCNQIDVVKNLIGQGVEVNLVDDFRGQTALQIAAFYGRFDVIKYLISEGAEVNKEDKTGHTAFHSAAQKCEFEVMEYLISQGAEVNKKDNNGRTALHLSTQNGRIDVIKYLISKGAEVNKEDNDGWTALHHCSPLCLYLFDIIEYLISEGAEVNKRDNNGRTALHCAAENGNIEVIEYLISQGAEVNEEDIDGQTALHLLSNCCIIEACECLISGGAEVNKSDKDGQTALHWAANHNDTNYVEYLISQGAEVNKGDNSGRTALHRAAFKGHIEVVEYLISQGAEVSKVNNDGKTALHVAESCKHIDVIEYLISKGAEVNKGDKDGRTALHCAAEKAHYDIIKYLISQGADVNNRTTNGWTVLHSAVINGHIDTIKYLIGQGVEVNKEDNDGRTVLHKAAEKGDADSVIYLIRKGAEVNKEDNDGLTALHMAAEGYNIYSLRYLIRNRAEVNKEDNDGVTALHRAAENGDIDFIRYLIRQGAEVTKGDNNSRTVLHCAAWNGHIEVVKYLISEGAEVNKGDNDGQTALHSVANSGHIDVIEYLISQGAEVTKGDNNGRTVLHRAVWNGHIEVIKYLISEGAEVNKGDKDGWTALHCAAEKAHYDIIKYLISQGADVNKRTANGWTVLHCAATNCSFSVIKYLLSVTDEVNRNAQDQHALLLKGDPLEVNKADNEGRTALHIAVQHGYIDVVEFLLSIGARSDTEDIRGQTPLHQSITLGHRDIVGLFIDKLNAKSDSVAIHLAVMHGHTSTIERMIAYGSDINVQSNDGQTCLHKAIKLCSQKKKIVEDTITLRKISDEYFDGGLYPEEALVFYLLELGARIDIKDEAGNLPINYAKDELVRQMILSRLPSLDAVQSTRDRLSNSTDASVKVNSNSSQEINLEGHEISMYLPPGAVLSDDSCQITLSIIRDNPGVITERESMACYGIRCDPQPLIFNKPVKITIPHSSLVVNPEQVKPDIVCRVWDSNKDLPKTLRKQTSSSPDNPPYCRLYERHLELYITHCAEWWVLIPLEQQVIRQRLMCTPYVPDRIERGQEFAVNLRLCNDLPGNEGATQEESRQQSYHRCHRSVPFNVETKAGDVTITCHREGEEIESQIVSLRDLLAKISQCISIYVPPSEDDLNFAVITITITQAGKLGISRSIAFVIRYTDEPVCQFPSEQTDITRTLEEVKNSDLQSDVDVLTIAQTMDVNQFYDLGIALGFTIAELDRVEYRRFRDRQQATFDMLLAWRGRQASTQAAKNTLITIIESFNSSSNDTTFPDIDPTEEISDCKLIQFSRHINKEKFYEIGKQLGFDDIELHHIEHRSLYNRKDANIQMLSMWKASQISSDKSDEKLKMVWESLNEASNVTDMNDDANSDDVTPLDLDVNSDPSPQETEEDEDEENEDWKIIEYLESDKDETIVDIDGHGGSPSNSELCTVVRPVANVTWALELAKALRLDVNDIIVLIAPRDPALMERLAWQLLHQWCRRLGRQENEEKVSTLLQGYNIENAQTGIGEICAKIRTTPDLIDLSQRLDLPASEILQVMASSLTFEPASIRRVVLQMLQRWVKQGGTRLRLLEVVQAFNFNDAAVHIARAIPSHPGFLDHLTHGIIDHDGGDLKLDEPDIRVSIPSGAIPKGMRSVVILTILKGSLSKFPLDPGEVLVTPTIRCSSNYDLLKSATIALPHCIDPDQYQEKKQDLCVKLYSKIGPGEYGYRTLFPCSTRDFEISEDRVTFSTRHLQYFALSSNDIHGVQFICEVSQPLFISNSSHPTLRICIAHPCNTTGVRGQNCRLSELFHEVTTAIKFNLESAEDDIKISCLTGSEKTQETVHACSLLSGGCNTININLPSSTDDKIVRVSIEQGLVTLAEQEINIRKEVEPDYEKTQRRGRLRFVSNDVIQVLTGLVSGIKNASELGYQLGFSHSMVSKYLSRADSSASIVSNAGLKEMIQDWRKRVRPSEQVRKLQLALETVGLRNEAEFIFHDT